MNPCAKCKHYAYMREDPDKVRKWGRSTAGICKLDCKMSRSYWTCDKHEPGKPRRASEAVVKRFRVGIQQSTEGGK